MPRVDARVLCVIGSLWIVSQGAARAQTPAVTPGTAAATVATIASPLDLPSSGESRDQRLPRGSVHEWQTTAAAGEYLEITLEAVGLEIDNTREWPTVSVIAPGGTHLLDLDGASTTLNIDIGARMIAAFVTPASGRYVVRVTARDQIATRLPYVLTTRRRGPATDADRARLLVHQAWRDAVTQFARGPRDGRRAALARLEATRGQLATPGNEEDLATTLSTIGAMNYVLNDVAAGQRAAAEARDIWQRLGRRREEGLALADLGLLAHLGFKGNEARDWLTQALTIAREVGDANAEALVLVHLGWVEFNAGDAPRAIELNQQAVPLWQQADNVAGLSVSWNDIGRAYADLGDVTQALDAYQAALAGRPADIDPGGSAVTLMRIGLLHLGVADWQPAFSALNRSLELARAAGDERTESNALGNLGVAYSRLGDRELAARYLNEALAAARKINNRGAEGAIMDSLGIEAYVSGDTEASLRWFQQALDLLTAIRDVRMQVVTLRYMASAQLRLGQAEAAFKSISASAELAQPNGVNDMTLTILATAHDALGHDAEAEATYLRALDNVRQVRALDREAGLLTRFGRFLASRGRMLEARDRLQQAVALQENLRAGLADADQRMQYSSRRIAPFESYLDVLMTLAADATDDRFAREAFRVAEQARGRGLLELMAASSVDIRQGVDRELVERERSLRWRLNAKAALRSSQLAGTANKVRLARLESEITELSAAWRETTTQIRQQSPSYAALTEPQPVTAEEAAGLLDADTVLLTFATGSSHTWLLALTPERLEHFELPPREAIDAVARDWHRLLTARQPVAGETAAARRLRVARADRLLARQSQALSDLVFGPAAERLATTWRGRRLAFVAAGALEYVPLAALPLPTAAATAAGRRPLLVTRHEVVMLPSVSSLAALRHNETRRAPRQMLAVIADPVFARDDPRVRAAQTTAAATTTAAPGAGAAAPFSAVIGTRGTLTRLPFSRIEAQAVAAQAPPASRLEATDFDASLELATSGRLADFRIVHLATHGIIDSERPELSGLALSLVDRQGRTRDGFLRLNTIYNMRLSADLVVLSACQTALGKEVAGEGLVGLTRGFMQAGARRVVASLWQVNDAATADLMRHFYSGLLQQHLPAAAALRRAQREMAADPRWSAPYYWAGFVLQGDWR